VRGKAGRVFGHLTALLAMMKGLPLAYNKDMQEDKEALFDTVDTVKACLEVSATVLSNIQLNETRMGDAATHGYLNATELADYLARKGVPFRDAHAAVGKLAATGKPLNTLSDDEFRAASGAFGPDVHEIFDARAALGRRTATGAPSPENIGRQIVRWRELLVTE